MNDILSNPNLLGILSGLTVVAVVIALWLAQSNARDETRQVKHEVERVQNRLDALTDAYYKSSKLLETQGDFLSKQHEMCEALLAERKKMVEDVTGALSAAAVLGSEVETFVQQRTVLASTLGVYVRAVHGVRDLDAFQAMLISDEGMNMIRIDLKRFGVEVGRDLSDVKFQEQ